MHRVLIALSLFLVSCADHKEDARPLNVILMIGDGMGIGQITAGRTAKGSLALDKFRVVGLLLTHAYGKDYITDSAAGATALSTGVKTFNGAIGVGPDSVARETLLERASRVGKHTGVVAVCSITEATPASFAAHVVSRRDQLEIAGQISESPVDLFFGGGWGWFLPEDKGGRRTDGRDLLQSMNERGFVRVSDLKEIEAEKGKILGLFTENSPGWVQDRQPSLPMMVVSAIDQLSGSAGGFVLVVEGSQIDWAAHNGNLEQMVAEFSDFDDAVAEALTFAENDGNTLVIVTADHETGGFAITGGSREGRSVKGSFVTGGHSGTMIALFASGPGADHFSGIHENTYVGQILLDMMH